MALPPNTHRPSIALGGPFTWMTLSFAFIFNNNLGDAGQRMNTIVMGGPDANARTDGQELKCEVCHRRDIWCKIQRVEQQTFCLCSSTKGPPTLTFQQPLHMISCSCCLSTIHSSLPNIQLLPIFQDSAHSISFKKPFMDFPSYPKRRKFYSFDILHIMSPSCGRQRSVSITRIQSHLCNPRTN